MSDIINEKWVIHKKNGLTSDEWHYNVMPEGSPPSAWEKCFMDNRTYYPDAPEPEVAQYIVDIHNFIVEQGGLDELQRRLRLLQELDDLLGERL